MYSLLTTEHERADQAQIEPVAYAEVKAGLCWLLAGLDYDDLVYSGGVKLPIFFCWSLLRQKVVPPNRQQLGKQCDRFLSYENRVGTIRCRI